MSTLVLEMEPAISEAAVTDEELALDLADGRSIRVPLSWYPRRFSPRRRNDNISSCWATVMRSSGPIWMSTSASSRSLAGRHSGESQKSLKRWLISRQKYGGSVPIPS